MVNLESVARETAHLLLSRILHRFGVDDAHINSIGLSEHEIAEALLRVQAETAERCAGICVDLMDRTERRTPNLRLRSEKSPVVALSEAASAIRVAFKKEGRDG